MADDAPAALASLSLTHVYYVRRRSVLAVEKAPVG